MAVTKLWPIRGRVDSPLNYAANEEKTANPRWDKSSLQNLTDVMHYAADEDKTEKQFFVSGVNCNPAIARDQFVTVKKQFDKEDGIVAYHGYQSFAEGEVTPEQAHEIGIELARRFWGDGYQVIIATHLNTKCVHNHFVVNSVSFKDGKRCRAKRWYDFNKVSDEICREHGLSVIENPRGKSVPAFVYNAEKAGAPTRLNLAKAAVDEAIEASQNLHEFRMALKAMGYSCNLDPGRKYWTIRQQDWRRPIRMYRMGDAYSNESIISRLEREAESKRFSSFQRIIVVKKRQYGMQTRGDRIRKVGGLKGLYLYYCYLLGYLPRYTKRTAKVSPLLRDDLIKMDRIAEETRMLCRENITTMEELRERIARCSETIEQKTSERGEIYTKSRRKIPEEERQSLRKQATAISRELKDLRKELKMLESIESRSAVIEEKIKEAEKESEVKKDERRR